MEKHKAKHKAKQKGKWKAEKGRQERKGEGR